MSRFEMFLGVVYGVNGFSIGVGAVRATPDLRSEDISAGKYRFGECKPNILKVLYLLVTCYRTCSFHVF